jgi:hypothetical protein
LEVFIPLLLRAWQVFLLAATLYTYAGLSAPDGEKKKKKDKIKK